MAKKAIIVIGAGDATGGAIAQRFAREGYVACVARRNLDKLTPLVERIKAEGGEVDAVAARLRAQGGRITQKAVEEELVKLRSE